MSVTYHALLSEDQDRPGMLYFGEARMALLDIEADFWGGVARRGPRWAGGQLTTHELYGIAMQAQASVVGKPCRR